jgi:hypothetical protein
MVLVTCICVAAKQCYTGEGACALPNASFSPARACNPLTSTPEGVGSRESGQGGGILYIITPCRLGRSRVIRVRAS